MDDGEEKLSNYQIAIENTLDFNKLINALKAGDNLQTPNIFKSYKHSLFSPFLSFLIKYINEYGEEKGIIGKAKINKIKVLYAVLNRKTYDFFFRRKKGFLKNDDNLEIDFETGSDEENYYLTNPNEETILDSNALKLMALKMIDEDETKFENKDLESLEKIYDFKKREIISTFRMGYSIQERIVSIILKNAKDKIKELPNILFYEKNNKKKLYQEVDRILLPQEEIIIPKIKVYYKCKYSSGVTNVNKFEKGEALKLEKNDIYFIEVKNSIGRLPKGKEKDKEKEENKEENKEDKEEPNKKAEEGKIKNAKKEEKNDEINNADKDGKVKSERKKGKKGIFITNKTPSNLSSKTSKSEDYSKKLPSNHFKHIKDFLELYKFCHINFGNKNIVYIIDSIFPYDFFETVEKFVNYYLEEVTNETFCIQFGQIEPDEIFLHETNVLDEIKDEFQKFKKDSKEQYEKLQNDSKLNINNLKEEYKKNIDEVRKKEKDQNEEFKLYKSEAANKYDLLNNMYINLNKNMKEKDDQMNKLNNIIENMNKELNSWKQKEQLRQLKKKTNEKILLKFVLNKYIKVELLNKKEDNLIIGDYFHEKFITSKTLFLNEINYYENIIDLVSFARSNYSVNDEAIINILENKYEKKLKIYSKIKFNNLLLFSDCIFFKKFITIFKEKFNDKKMTIIPMIEDNLFIIKLEPKKEKNINSEFQINIPGLNGYVNIDKCKNMLNFIDYIFELKEIDIFKNIVDFHIYNPYTDQEELFISSFNNDVYNEKLLICIYNDLCNIPALVLEGLKNEYKYMLLIYDRKNLSDETINSVGNYFYRDKQIKIYRAPQLIYDKLMDLEKEQILKCENKNIVYNKSFSHVHYLYKFNNNGTINLNFNNADEIPDNNIKALYKNLVKQNALKNILIEEPTSIISLLLKNKDKSLNIVQLQNNCEKNIRKKIREKTQINFTLIKNKNIINYLKDREDKYDAIIFENDSFPDENKGIIPDKEYFKQDNLSLFMNHLNNSGRIYIHLLIRNKYLYNFVEKEISEKFKIINSIKLFELEFLLICSHKM